MVQWGDSTNVTDTTSGKRYMGSPPPSKPPLTPSLGSDSDRTISPRKRRNGRRKLIDMSHMMGLQFEPPRSPLPSQVSQQPWGQSILTNGQWTAPSATYSNPSISHPTTYIGTKTNTDPSTASSFQQGVLSALGLKWASEKEKPRIQFSENPSAHQAPNSSATAPTSVGTVDGVQVRYYEPPRYSDRASWDSELDNDDEDFRQSYYRNLPSFRDPLTSGNLASHNERLAAEKKRHWWGGKRNDVTKTNSLMRSDWKQYEDKMGYSTGASDLLSALSRTTQPEMFVEDWQRNLASKGCSTDFPGTCRRALADAAGLYSQSASNRGYSRIDPTTGRSYPFQVPQSTACTKSHLRSALSKVFHGNKSSLDHADTGLSKDAVRAWRQSHHPASRFHPSEPSFAPDDVNLPSDWSDDQWSSAAHMRSRVPTYTESVSTAPSTSYIPYSQPTALKSAMKQSTVQASACASSNASTTNLNGTSPSFGSGASTRPGAQMHIGPDGKARWQFPDTTNITESTNQKTTSDAVLDTPSAAAGVLVGHALNGTCKAISGVGSILTAGNPVLGWAKGKFGDTETRDSYLPY